MGNPPGNDGEYIAAVGNLLIVECHKTISVIAEADFQMVMEVERVGMVIIVKVFCAPGLFEQSQDRAAQRNLVVAVIYFVGSFIHCGLPGLSVEFYLL